MRVINMNKNIYLSFLLAAALGLAVPAFAEVVPAPEHPADVTSPATTPDEHKAAAVVEKTHAEYHKGMAEHHKSVAKEYEQAGHKDLKKHHEAMAKHHEALAKEHEETAKTHEKLTK